MWNEDKTIWFHTERNWLVPLRVIEVIKIAKADFYETPILGLSKKKDILYYRSFILKLKKAYQTCTV